MSVTVKIGIYYHKKLLETYCVCFKDYDVRDFLDAFLDFADKVEVFSNGFGFVIDMGKLAVGGEVYGGECVCQLVVSGREDWVIDEVLSWIMRMALSCKTRYFIT